MVASVLLMILAFCVLGAHCCQCLGCPLLPVSVDCPFLIASSVFSNVYFVNKLVNSDVERDYFIFIVILPCCCCRFHINMQVLQSYLTCMKCGHYTGMFPNHTPYWYKMYMDKQRWYINMKEIFVYLSIDFELPVNIWVSLYSFLHLKKEI